MQCRIVNILSTATSYTLCRLQFKKFDSKIGSFKKAIPIFSIYDRVARTDAKSISSAVHVVTWREKGSRFDPITVKRIKNSIVFNELGRFFAKESILNFFCFSCTSIGVYGKDLIENVLGSAANNSLQHPKLSAKFWDRRESNCDCCICEDKC